MYLAMVTIMRYVAVLLATDVVFVHDLHIR